MISNGDRSWRRGVGLDWRVTKQLFAGAEATWRDINVPIFSLRRIKLSLKRIRSSWIEPIFSGPDNRILAEWAGHVRYILVRDGQLDGLWSTPKSLKTFSVPVAARYFDPNGFFAGVVGTYVDQDVVRTPTALQSGFSDGRSDFFVVDAGIGWRFPKRLGIATVTVRNVFNEKFRYQDDSFREFRGRAGIAGPYVPERQVVGRATLYF